ncbi:alpha/beta fold hydrolase [Cellulomonas soli]|uniref:Lysophospholipase n=1 Tax=Cellulomonas soli TaxID=931535 RepID=A0A512PH94_9CELL|nr:alpha/beta fold hydrolase [Cellulomonas soli]NYI60845.1 pimeloyl-ACP methyl ester carboxylesterase [Cellulomonas soli]GEP70571.1 lysophospholipase [Cellulomonas soli]
MAPEPPPPDEETIIRRPIVLVHGTRTSSAIWQRQVDALTRSGHPTVALDLPGHGARADERFTWDGAMTAIDDAVASCATPPLLVGLSLGGYAALGYAGEHQSKLAGVVLAGCSTELRGKPLGAYRHASHHVTRWLHLGGGTWHVVTDMLAALAGYSPLADLRRLQLPVWIVNGSRDPLRMDERRYRGVLPDLRLHVVRGAGHDVNSHAPVAFNRVLLDAMHHLRRGEAGLLV